MERLNTNALFGLLGFAIPTLVLLAAYPTLINHLGSEAFGVYIVITSLSGALAFADLGCSAAATKFVAEDMARNRPGDAADIIQTARWFYALVGSTLGFGIWIAAPWLVPLFSVPEAIQAEAVWALRMGAVQFSAFFVMMSNLAIFKGLQRFELATATLSLLSVLTYGGATAGVLLGGFRLLGVTSITLAANLVALLGSTLVLGRACRKYGIALGAGKPSWATFRRMFRFGAFMSINTIAGILVNQAMRIVLTVGIGPAAVTVFTTATTAVSKLHAAINAASESVMPAAAAALGRRPGQDIRLLRRRYLQGLGISAGLSFSGMAALWFLSPILVPWWLHSGIDGEVVALVRILCIGFALNGVTPLTYHLINGLGYPQVNTVFFVLSPVILYGVAFGLGGPALTTETFAIAYSFTLGSLATVYVLFSELVLWRRWIPLQEAAPTAKGIR